MFNFLENFSQHKSLQTLEFSARASKSATIITAKEIHNEIYLSGDDLVKVLNEQIADYVEIEIDPVRAERAKMLKDCGFENHPDLINFEKVKEGIDKERQLIKEKKEDLILIDEFNSMYPDCKIVHADDLQKICKKYGLQLAPVTYYTGELPDKNLKEISKFFNREPNQFSHQAFVSSYTSMRQSNPTEISWKSWQAVKKQYESETKRSLIGTRFHRNFNSIISMHSIEKKPLEICCLSKDLAPNWQYLKQLKELIKEDPIVFVRHNKFAIIISAWGAEAKDVELL